MGFECCVKNCEFLVIDRQLSVGSGQWAVGSGQGAVGSGQWAVGSWQLTHRCVEIRFLRVLHLVTRNLRKNRVSEGASAIAREIQFSVVSGQFFVVLSSLACCVISFPVASESYVWMKSVRASRSRHRSHLISILRKSQKPGFSLYFSSPNPKTRRNPVSRHERKSQKLVDLYISRHPTQKLKDVKWVL